MRTYYSKMFIGTEMSADDFLLLKTYELVFYSSLHYSRLLSSKIQVRRAASIEPITSEIDSVF